MAEREREIIPLEEFTRRLRAQGVPREHATGKPSPAGPGCNWTLGGLLRIHELEVQTVPWFRVASPEEAQALMREVPRG